MHRGVINWMAKNKPRSCGRNGCCRSSAKPGMAISMISTDLMSRPRMTGLAIEAARGGAIEEGSVGGGTGMNCYGFKGGNGTASRLVSFGGSDLHRWHFPAVQFRFALRADGGGHRAGTEPAHRTIRWRIISTGELESAGSCIGVLATDAPLLPGQLAGLARRMPLGLARTGTTGSHFSGDIFLAFSTANDKAWDSGYAKTTPDKADLATAISCRGASSMTSMRPASMPPKKRCSMR